MSDKKRCIALFVLALLAYFVSYPEDAQAITTPISDILGPDNSGLAVALWRRGGRHHRQGSGQDVGRSSGGLEFVKRSALVHSATSDNDKADCPKPESRQETLLVEELNADKLKRLLTFISHLERTPDGAAELRRRTKLFGECQTKRG